jgi:hypothetical protein
MTAFKVTGGNSLFGAGVGFNLDSKTADSLTVDIDAFVISTADDAVVLANTSAWTATINGTAYSQGDIGLDLAQGNIGMSKINIGVAGSISGVNALVLRSNAMVVNKGHIDGVDTGVAIFDSSCTFTNYGTIDGGFLVDSVGVRTIKITNTSTGVINGGIDVLANGVTITNSATIFGTVNLLNSETNTISNSNYISELILGDGKNVFTNSGSIFYGVTFGDGIDIVTNSGDLNLTSTFVTIIDLKGGNDIFKNTSLESIKVDMGAGDDQFSGGNGVETVLDAAGSDKFSLGGGNDSYFASAVIADGTDTIDGGAGIDDYDARLAGVGVNINLDNVAHNFAFGPPLVLAANSAQQGAVKDIIKNFEWAVGSYFNDNIAGSAAVNRIAGFDGDDRIFGYAGNDLIQGNTGNDVLCGGAGADELRGGGGSDQFHYEKITDSPPSGRDHILDFESTESDIISLSAIDANTKNGSANNDAFVYIGANVSFTGFAGQLRSYWTKDGWILEGDVNGDKKADMAIAIADANHDINWGVSLIL